MAGGQPVRGVRYLGCDSGIFQYRSLAESRGGVRYRALLLVAMSVVAIFILAAMLWKIDRQDNLTATGLALIFGGAVGNVWDRVRAGSVTDFLDFYAGSYHWYTFNLADSAICVGAGLLILSMLMSNRKKEANA